MAGLHLLCFIWHPGCQMKHAHSASWSSWFPHVLPLAARASHKEQSRWELAAVAGGCPVPRSDHRHPLPVQSACRCIAIHAHDSKPLMAIPLPLSPLLSMCMSPQRFGLHSFPISLLFHPSHLSHRCVFYSRPLHLGCLNRGFARQSSLFMCASHCTIRSFMCPHL